jgi:hypothetical protein
MPYTPQPLWSAVTDDKETKLTVVSIYGQHRECIIQIPKVRNCLNVIFQHPVALYRSDFGAFLPSMCSVVHYSNDYDGRPTQHTTPAPARTFKAATSNKPNKTKSNHVQLKDTQIKLMVTHITKITRGNYNRTETPHYSEHQNS